jgi:hypothetical protein
MNRKAVLTASAAFLAVVAAPALHAQGKGNDNGAGGKNGASAQPAQRGNSAGQGSGGNASKNDRGGPSAGTRDAPGRSAAEGTSQGKAQQGGSADNARSAARGNAPDDRGAGNSAKVTNSEGGGVRGARLGNPGVMGGIGGTGGYALRELRDTFGSRPRLIDGCPPGLAKKRNGCLPPGLAQNQYRSFEPGFFGLIGADSGRYLYQDGYLLRYRPDGLAGFLPLLGGALGIGNVWPASYQSAPLPAYYSEYYRLGDDRSYRYADNVIYRVNPETAAITSVAGLLTGDDIAIGQPMPRGYDVYNVPMAYRDRYADSPQARYRYANGYVYEIDPANSLVASAIALVL